MKNLTSEQQKYILKFYDVTKNQHCYDSEPYKIGKLVNYNNHLTDNVVSELEKKDYLHKVTFGSFEITESGVEKIEDYLYTPKIIKFWRLFKKVFLFLECHWKFILFLLILILFIILFFKGNISKNQILKFIVDKF